MTPKRINSISNKKNGIEISFDDEVILVNEDVFTNHFLYVGKEVSEEELKTIRKEVATSKGYSYCLNLISKKPYSSKNLINKLINVKKVNYYDACNIVERLKSLNLINDKEYAFQLIDELDQKCYGYNHIVETLIQDGIDVKTLNYSYEEDIELEKAKKLLPNLINKYRLYNSKKMIDSIYDSMLMRGFSSFVVLEVIKTIDKNELSNEDEQKLLRDYNLIVLRMNDEEKLERKSKIIDKLMRKGYLYNDIIKVIEGDK